MPYAGHKMGQHYNSDYKFNKINFIIITYWSLLIVLYNQLKFLQILEEKHYSDNTLGRISYEFKYNATICRIIKCIK